METKEKQIQAIKDAFERAMAEINERREYRMRNYYDCIDDYSFGGICDKADNELEDMLRMQRDIKIEQVENDGFYFRTSMFYRLCDNDGNAALGTKHGQWGEFFVINDKCVSVPKRLATLTKKGYKLEQVIRTYKCELKSIRNGHAINKSMTVIEEKVIDITQDSMPDYIGGLPYIDWQYESYFKN